MQFQNGKVPFSCPDITFSDERFAFRFPFIIQLKNDDGKNDEKRKRPEEYHSPGLVKLLLHAQLVLLSPSLSYHCLIYAIESAVGNGSRNNDYREEKSRSQWWNAKFLASCRCRQTH